MVDTAQRTYSRQRVICPTDSSLHVDIPVIDSTVLGCMAEQAQEYRWTIKNGFDNQARTVHTFRLTNFADFSQYVDVERIDNLRGKITANQQQDYLWNFKNFDPPPQPPQLIGQDPAHLKVHYVRYYKDNDTNSHAWIDVELIDQIKIKCMAEQAQEYIFYMKHPPIGDQVPPVSGEFEPPDPYQPTVAICDSSLPLLDGNAPWRFDPFQNPVNVNWQSPTTTGPVEFVVWIEPGGTYWQLSWYEKWGGVINVGPYPYFGEPPTFPYDAGAADISWHTWYSVTSATWEDYLPELIPLREAWEQGGMVAMPEFQVTIVPPWEPPPTA